MPLLHQLLWFPESCFHISEQPEAFDHLHKLAFEYELSTGRAQSHRQGSEAPERFGARVANKRAVPSLQPGSSRRCSAVGLLAQARAGVKAVGLRTRAAQAAGRCGGQLRWTAAHTWLFFQPLKAEVREIQNVR